MADRPSVSKTQSSYMQQSLLQTAAVKGIQPGGEQGNLVHRMSPTAIGNGSLSDRVVDIDIGTLGIPIASTGYLLTFDPFDVYDASDSHERFPYAIGDQEGSATFYVNDEVNGCSSLYPSNPIFQHNATALDDVAECLVPCPTCLYYTQACRKPQRSSVKHVDVIRLSTLLKHRDVQRIGFLKIDAQGADFSILKDVLDNTMVDINKIQVECQRYDETHAFYDSFNDCSAIKAFVHRKHPAYNVSEWSQNCMAAEYNVVFSKEG